MRSTAHGIPDFMLLQEMKTRGRDFTKNTLDYTAFLKCVRKTQISIKFVDLPLKNPKRNSCVEVIFPTRK